MVTFVAVGEPRRIVARFTRMLLFLLSLLPLLQGPSVFPGYSIRVQRAYANMVLRGGGGGGGGDEDGGGAGLRGGPLSAEEQAQLNK